MEINYSQTVNYSVILNVRKQRDLADHLDITLRELVKLIDRGDLLDEYETGVLKFLELNPKLAIEESRDGIEFENITTG